MTKSKRNTNIFIFILLPVCFSLIVDVLLSILVMKFDLRLLITTYLVLLLPLFSAFFTTVVFYIPIGRVVKNKIAFSLAIFLITFVIALQAIPISIGVISISNDCDKMAPHPCLL